MAKSGLNTFFKSHQVFLGLLLLGLLLRVLFIEFQGLSNDELSAWYRTRFDDWTTFWNQGVKVGDMHPVFYQAFLHLWVKVFGDSEWAIRSTGLLFYTLNSTLIYTISNRFFSKNTGLGIIALYTCLTFTIINTTLARPYNSGTFFLLLCFLSLLEINRSSKKINLWHLGIILGFLGAMTSHYFAFLSAGIIGIIGLFYLNRKRKLDLVICGVIAVLCFLPHWPVTQYQLNVGGLGWLPAPKSYWVLQFFGTFFNHSWFVFMLFLGLLIPTFKNHKYLTKEELFALAIFVVTYITGHLISIFYTPVLRDLVLLFILPFLFLFLFRKFGQIKRSLFLNFTFTFPIIIGLHSIIIGHLLQPENFGVFRELGRKINLLQLHHENQNCEFASNYNNVEYLNYYLNQPLKEPITDWSSPETVYQLADRAKNSTKKQFVYSWSNSFHLPIYYEVILNYFPRTLEQNTYFNSAFRLYSKKGRRKLKETSGILTQPVKKVITSDEFMGEQKINIGDIQKSLHPNQYLLLKSVGELSKSTPFYFVVTLERNGEILMNGKDPLLYQAYDQSRLNPIGQSANFFTAFDLPDGILPDDQLKIYFWNPEKSRTEIGRTRIYFVDK